MRMRGTGFELDRSEGKLFGVCAGLGRTTGIDPIFFRVGAVLMALFASFTWTVLGYGVLAVIGLTAAKRREGGSMFPRVRGRDEEVPERIRSHELRMRAIETYTASANSRLAREIEDLR